MPLRFEPTDVIVDVGGHIGAFAHACLMRGAGKVITCGTASRHLNLLRRNLARYGDRVEVIPAAVWPAGELAMLSPTRLRGGEVREALEGTREMDELDQQNGTAQHLSRSWTLAARTLSNLWERTDDFDASRLNEKSGRQ
ncbi:MAG: hypothetical protein M3R04_08105 [bacterium]|nr:hypothetical protein [bacterium]